MANQHLSILNAGLVTSIGLSAESTCAAIRSAITNHTTTAYLDSAGEWIMGAQVALESAWRGRVKLTKMLALAIDECLARLPATDRENLPLVLGVAEADRPGRLEDLDDQLFDDVEGDLELRFDRGLSRVIPEGRVSVPLALMYARQIIEARATRYVLIAACDSLLLGPTLAAYDAEHRILTTGNPNGFVPGEAAGAILLSANPRDEDRVTCIGMGVGQEQATIYSDVPLRGKGLTQAIRKALADAACEMHDVDFRITDNSGEHYYFKEAALALSQTLRTRKDSFDIWHPADCIGEVGAAIGTTALAVAMMSAKKRYSPGNCVLFHAGADAGARTATILRYA